MNGVWTNLAYSSVNFKELKEMLTVKQKVLHLAKEAGFNEVDHGNVNC